MGIRISHVYQTLKDHHIHSAIDIGCGDGQLLEVLAEDQEFQKLAGVDPDAAALEEAKIHLQTMVRDNLTVRLESISALAIDNSFQDYEAVTMVEVFEHFARTDIPKLEPILFNQLQPKLVIITTPDGSVKLPMQRSDHFHEWTPEETKTWAKAIVAKYPYKYQLSMINGATFKRDTQLMVFTALPRLKPAIEQEIGEAIKDYQQGKNVSPKPDTPQEVVAHLQSL